MKVTKIKEENLSCELSVVVDAQHIKDQIDAQLQRLSKRVKMPGFREGKVPLDVVRKKYTDSVTGEVLDETVKKTSMQALEQQGIQPAFEPSIEITDFKAGSDLTYTMKVEVMPEIPAVDLSKLSITRPMADVTDKDVTELLTLLKDEHKHYHPVATPRPAKKGDAVIIDFEGFLDGVAFKGGKGEGVQLELGANQFVPGFEEQLEGANAGDEKEINITFPKDYGSSDLAGKDTIFKVKVHEVQELHENELDDHFAQHMGLKDLDSLKDAVKSQLEKEASGLTRAHIKKQLFDELDNNYTFDVPKKMVEAEFKVIWQQLQEARRQNPADADLDKPDDTLKEEYTAMAERRVKLGILLANIGKEHKISVSQNELQSALRMEAMRYPGQEQQVIEYYQKNPEAIDAFRGPILEEKVVDLMLSKASVKDNMMALEALRSKEMEDGSPSGKSSKKESVEKKPATKKPAKSKKLS